MGPGFLPPMPQRLKAANGRREIPMLDEVDAREGALFPRDSPPESIYLSRLLSLAMAVMLGLPIAIILLPDLSTRHHGTGRRLHCASNLRQLGLGIEQYARTYN